MRVQDNKMICLEDGKRICVHDKRPYFTDKDVKDYRSKEKVLRKRV